MRRSSANRLAVRLGASLLLALAGPCAAYEATWATLWMQTSAEYRVLVGQIFDQARRRLPDSLAAPAEEGALENLTDAISRSPAVVLDIDETVLDNSPLRASNIVRDAPGFDPAWWDDWVLGHRAESVPGALAYVKSARELGLEVFYVSNRACASPGVCPQERATIRNLTELGFPDVDDRRLLLKDEEPGWTSEKASRRSQIAREYRIVQLIGDDLGDFIPGMRDAGPEQRLRLIGRYGSRFGSNWFLLPNPAYGSWVSALGDSPFVHLRPDRALLCHGELTPIRHLQGPGGETHCEGITITTRAVVERVRPGDDGPDGYLLRDAGWDGRSAVRELVFLDHTASGIAEDDLIEVRGRVADHGGSTVLVPEGPDSVRVLREAGAPEATAQTVARAGDGGSDRRVGAARAFLASIQEDSDLQRWLDARLDGLLARDARARDANLSVALLDLGSDGLPRLAHRNGKQRFYPASVVKFVYLMAAYAWQEQGRLRIDAGLDRQLTAMIHGSSNQATQRVFRTLTRTEAGPDLEGSEYAAFRDRRMAVKRWLEGLGITGIHSIHPTYDGGGDLYGRDLQLLRDGGMEGGISNAGGTLRNRQAMTAIATARLLGLLASDLALSPTHGEEVRQRMRRDPAKQPYQRNRIARGAMASPGVEVYSKSGTWGPIFADAGIIRGPSGRQLALAVFMESDPAYRGGFIADLARACARDLL